MIKKILFLVLLVLGLVGGLWMVKRNQELRRGATGGIVNLYLKPDGSVDLSGTEVGDRIKVMVLGKTNDLGIGGFSLRFRYDKSKLKLSSANDVGVHSNFAGFKMADIKNVDGLVDVISIALDDEIEGLIADINNPLLWLNFEVIGLGSARVYMDSGWSDMSVFGLDSQNDSYVVEAGVGNSLDITYDIGGGGASPVPTTEPSLTPTDVPSPQSTGTPIPVATSTSIPEATPTLPINAKTVSFEVALAGLREQNRCRGSNTVDVIMLNGSNRKEYRNVALVDTGRKTGTNLTIFKVDKLNVTDFGETSDVAIFVKGQKHLQMKYGIDGQDAVYNRAGGELDFDNLTIFDFTKYPILAGDVNRDGKVDGIDFTEVKNRAGRFEEVESGQSNVHDLDSSCVVNNVDIGLLTQALREKYDQMY